jgi:LPS-assembly protein
MAAALACAQQAAAQPAAAADAPLALKLTPMLDEALPRATSDGGGAPVFISGNRLSGRSALETVLEGQAQLRKPGLVVRAEYLAYDQGTDIATAPSGVQINARGNRYTGAEARIKVDAFAGFVLRPTYQFLATGGYGEGARIDFLDPERSVIEEATYSSCRRDGAQWLPDWIVRAARLSIDQELDEGYAEGAKLQFKGLTLLPVPAFTFPLTAQRKSGWLPPTVGLDNTAGAQFSIPYYWNIAPNRDATVSLGLMSKRGADFGGQLRYLEPAYAGVIDANVLPNDNLRRRARWGLFARHSGWVDAPLAGPLGLNISLNRVSDNDYWRDFTSRGQTLTSRLLSNDGLLSWGRGNFSMSARALKWQTLQDPDLPIVPPYDRLPQLNARWASGNGGGAAAANLDYALEADYTRFRADPLLTRQPNADRALALAQVAWPWMRSWGFLTPKLMLHAANYQFDAPLRNGRASASLSVPTLSLDGGLFFERDASYFGRAFQQTLEPRLKYVHTPYRNQSHLPNYDSGLYDFNFATIWAENAFAGNDRVVDNNLVTFGLTSRLLDPDSGAEALRLDLAQRYRFSEQKVTLAGSTPSRQGLSDIMLGTSLHWDARWSFDMVLQYNLDTSQSTRTATSVRYAPGRYRTLNLSYLRERDLGTRQVDLSWQWPLGDLLPGSAKRGQPPGRWYSVGRLNYSAPERKLVNAVMGVEYDAGCWIARMVFSKLQTSSGSANKSIMFQLEFVGFSALGSNPSRTLRNNISNYQLLREEIVPPSRFTQYD